MLAVLHGQPDRSSQPLTAWTVSAAHGTSTHLCIALACPPLSQVTVGRVSVAIR